MFIETGITIELFMSVFPPKARKNCLSKNVLTSRIPGPACGTSPVLDIYPLAIRLLSLPGGELEEELV